jgi:hypothetical protein
MTQAKQVWTNPYIPWDKHTEDAQEVIRAAWISGQLSYKLSPAQRAVYDEIRAWEQSKTRLGRTFILDIGRRFGKSSIMVLIAFEDAFRNPGWRIPYYGVTHKDLMRFIDEHLQKILSDCPPDLRPYWTNKDSTYRLPHNGSKIEMIGLDVNPDGARGGSFDKALMDESAFFDNLETIVQSVLQPQMMGRPHARIIAGSTPPVSPSHYWTQAMIPTAIAEKAILTRTIDDADIYPEHEKEEFIRKLGGRRAVQCRRELFTEHVTDETLAIVPEFRDVENEITREVVAPMWRDCWVSMDPGWKDHTAVLFGYWHFAEGCLVLEDEISAPRLHSSIIAEQIRQREAALWTGSTCRSRNGLRGEQRVVAARPQPFMRVSDNDQRLLYDLQVDHGLAFSVTPKDNLDQQINSLRNAIAGKRIWIHPRCTMTRKQLRNGVWKNEARKIFAREGGDLGHFDLIAALVYLWRGVSQYRTRNPAPIAEKYIAGDLKAKHETDPDKQDSKWARRSGRIWFKAQRPYQHGR